MTSDGKPRAKTGQGEPAEGEDNSRLDGLLRHQSVPYKTVGAAAARQRVSSFPPPQARRSGVRKLPGAGGSGQDAERRSEAPATLEQALHEAVRSARAPKASGRRTIPPPPQAPREAPTLGNRLNRAARADGPVDVDWDDAASYRGAEAERRRVDSPLKKALFQAAEGPGVEPTPERRQSRSARPTPLSAPPASLSERTGAPAIPGLRGPDEAKTVGARAPRGSSNTPRAYPGPGRVTRDRDTGTPYSGVRATADASQARGEVPWNNGETALIPMSGLAPRRSSWGPRAQRDRSARGAFLVFGSLLVLGLGVAMYSNALPGFDRLRAALSPVESGTLTPTTRIETIPPGAELHVGDVVIGNTPLTVAHASEPVTYTVRKPGHAPQAVQVRAGSPERIEIALQPAAQ